MIPKQARARLDEMYADPHAFTSAEYAEIAELVNIIQDAQEAAIDGRAGSDEHATERGPLTALMSDSQREQMVRI